MQILNLSGYGINVHVDGGKLVVKDGNNSDKEPQEKQFRRTTLDFDKLVISGNSGNISLAAIKWLTKQKRDIVVLDWNGRLVTQMSPAISNQGLVKVAQYKAYSDPAKQAKIAKWIIEQKIQGCLRILEWISQKRPDFEYSKFTRFAGDIQKANDARSVLSVEAKISQFYWKALATTFDAKWEFISRHFGDAVKSKDADDPVNALFNYGYAVLESECWKVINTMGLEPHIGFIHMTHTNKAPLVYDLQEPFRWIVDKAILKIIYEKKVTKNDFMRSDEGNIILKRDAVKVVLDEIALQFRNKTNYKGKKREWQTMITLKTREMIKMF